MAAAIWATAAASIQFIRLVAQYPESQVNGILTLRGNYAPLSWSNGVPMNLVGQDTWVFDMPVSTTSSGQLCVKALINDQQWQLGANVCIDISLTVAAQGADALPTQQNYSNLQVAGLATFYPWFSQSTGSYFVATSAQYAPGLADQRPVLVYLPPSYNENPYKRYPVLLGFDGQNLCNVRELRVGWAF